MFFYLSVILIGDLKNRNATEYFSSDISSRIPYICHRKQVPTATNAADSWNITLEQRETRDDNSPSGPSTSLQEQDVTSYVQGYPSGQHETLHSKETKEYISREDSIENAKE